MAHVHVSPPSQPSPGDGAGEQPFVHAWRALVASLLVAIVVLLTWIIATDVARERLGPGTPTCSGGHR